MGRALLLFLCGLGLGCASTPDAAWRQRPGSAELRAFYYFDNSGLSVATVGAVADQPVSRHLTVSARTFVDNITIERKPLVIGTADLAGQPTGHPQHDPDVVTSASSTVAGGGIAHKWRVEGQVALTGAWEARGNPLSLRAQLRISQEPDYKSYYGLVRGAVELFQRNTTLGWFLGAGQDSVEPVEAPPGQENLWPAQHRRVNGGLTLTQLLSPRLVLTASLAGTVQRGLLANPYRRALVRTTLFPETVPSARDRIIGSAQLSVYLSQGAALHLRLGAYADTWQVLGIIPEFLVAKQLAARGLLTFRYRFYKQSQAEFYLPRYPNLSPQLSGDERLGPIKENAVGTELRWTLFAAARGAGALTLTGGYDVSFLDYELLNTATITGHIVSLSLSGAY